VGLGDIEGVSNLDLRQTSPFPKLRKSEGIIHRVLVLLNPESPVGVGNDLVAQVLEWLSAAHGIAPSSLKTRRCSSYRSSAAGTISSYQSSQRSVLSPPTTGWPPVVDRRRTGCGCCRP